jgi:hypothetical protein
VNGRSNTTPIVVVNPGIAETRIPNATPKKIKLIVKKLTPENSKSIIKKYPFLESLI